MGSDQPSSYEQSTTKVGTPRSSAIKKGKMSSTNKMRKITFPLNSKQDYSPESKRSPPSLPYLIIGKENKVLGILILI
jgi:hypothetical protein